MCQQDRQRSGIVGRPHRDPDRPLCPHSAGMFQGYSWVLSKGISPLEILSRKRDSLCQRWRRIYHMRKNVVVDAPLRDAISEEVETRGASSGHSSAPPRTQHHAGREYAPSLRESFICLSPPGPVTIPRYAPPPVRGSVHLSRQSLEKLTESAPSSRSP